MSPILSIWSRFIRIFRRRANGNVPKTPSQQMYAAVRAGDADEVRRILAKHPQELMGSFGVTPSWLHYAASKGHVQVIDVFLQAGLDVNWVRRDPDMTPLVDAVQDGQYHAARHLLALGANPNLGRCLISAINADAHSFDLVKLLVEHGADVNQVWRFGDEERGPLFNALSWAVNGDREDVAAYLRAHGAVMPPAEAERRPSAPDEEIIDYFQQRFGPVDARVLREIVPTAPSPVEIHRIGPTPDRDSVILFTTGMSLQALGGSAEAGSGAYAEVLVELPSDWPLAGKALRDMNHRWPIDWLRRIAQLSGDADTALRAPVSIMENSDPPSPLAPGCSFSAMLLVAGYDDLGPIALADGRSVDLFAMVPLYPNEVELEQSEGLVELFRRLEQFDIGRKVDLRRPSVAAIRKRR